MPEWTESIHVDVSQADAYAYRADFGRLGTYNPDVRDVVVNSDGSWDFRLRIAGFPLRGHIEIIEADPPHWLDVVIHAGMPAYEHCTFTPDEGGTRIAFETRVDTPGGPVRPLLDRVFFVPQGRRQTIRELTLLKGILETADDSSLGGSGGEPALPRADLRREAGGPPST